MIAYKMKYLVFMRFLIFPIGLWVQQSAAEPKVAEGEYDPRYGTYVGSFNTLWHDVVGELYAIDNITMYIKKFSYDGEAPG